MKLTIKYPVKPFVVNQRFGDSQACVEKGTGPLASKKILGKIGATCPIGYVELYPLLGMKGHTGIDVRATHNQPLYHCGSAGIVEEVCTEVERGLGIGVISSEKYSFPDGDFNIKLRYWHLNSIKVRLGQTVDTGDELGACDNTGISAGDHLHFEVKRVAKNSLGKWYNVDQNNGYFGSIDPYQFFDGTYAVDTRIVLLTKILELSKKLLEYIKAKNQR